MLFSLIHKMREVGFKWWNFLLSVRWYTIQACSFACLVALQLPLSFSWQGMSQQLKSCDKHICKQNCIQNSTKYRAGDTFNACLFKFTEWPLGSLRTYGSGSYIIWEFQGIRISDHLLQLDLCRYECIMYSSEFFCCNMRVESTTEANFHQVAE